MMLTQEQLGVLPVVPAEPSGVPRSYIVQKLREIPHVDRPWTQGLEFSDGQLIEASGDFPQGTGSYVRIVDPATGGTVRKITDGLGTPVFIEGIAKLGNSWFASTYVDHKLVQYDDQFKLVASHAFPWEGWGLARSVDENTFYATNSTEYLMYLDAQALQLKSVKVVTCLGQPVQGVNELESVADFFGRGPALLGNIINTRLVLVMDPSTAQCTGVFHLNDLEPKAADEAMGYHVANGIAYNAQADTYWLTGKNWKMMFEVNLAEDEQADAGQAVQMLSTHLAKFR